MGINVKGLHHVVGYSASRDVDDYFQESTCTCSRVGYDGLQSHANLLNYKSNFRKGKTDQAMIKYVQTNGKCCQTTLMEHYCHTTSSPPLQHNCCDICSKICICEGTQSVNKENWMSHISLEMPQASAKQNTEGKVCREPNEEVRKIIKANYSYYSHHTQHRMKALCIWEKTLLLVFPFLSLT